MKKRLLIWMPMMIIIPVVLIWGISAVIHLIVPYNPDTNAVLFDLSTGITISEYLQIYAAFVGAEVTLFIGYVIYKLGEEKAEKEHEKVVSDMRVYINNELDNCLSSIYEFITVGHGYQTIDQNYKSNIKLPEINEKWLENLMLIRKDIETTSYSILLDFFNDYQKLFLNQELGWFINKYTIPFYPNDLLMSDKKIINAYEDVISYSLYKSKYDLVGKENITERNIKFNNGMQFYIEKNLGKSYVVYDNSGNKVIDFNYDTKKGFRTEYLDSDIIQQGIFDGNKQMDGYVKNAYCDTNGRFIKESHSNNFVELDVKYDPENIFHKIIANYEIHNGEHILVGDIQYVQKYI